MKNKNVDPNKKFLKRLENAMNIYARALLSQRIKIGIKNGKEKKYV